MDSCHEWVALLSDVSLGMLALWQGFVILSDLKLKRLAGLGNETKESSFWFRLRKFDRLVLLIITTGFALAIIMRIVLMFCHTD